MGNEIKISAMTGLTLKVQLYNGVNAIGPLLTTQEISGLGEYVTSMPVNIPFGSYTVLAVDNAGLRLGSGFIEWDGNYEMSLGLAILQGLNKQTPSTTTPTTWKAGDIDLIITGDGVNLTTITRQ